MYNLKLTIGDFSHIVCDGETKEPIVFETKSDAWLHCAEIEAHLGIYDEIVAEIIPINNKI